jgi:hypothetical protein
MPDPFGEQPAPWWRSEWWQGLWSGANNTAPVRYSRPVAVLSALVVLVTTGDHLDLAARIVVMLLILGVPSILLERWWKERRRYESEQLMVLPDASERDTS